MSRLVGIALLVASATVLANATRAAAEDQWRVAIGADAIHSQQDAAFVGNGSNPSIPTPSLGGSSTGFNVSGQFRMTHMFGIGIDVSDTSPFEGLQTGRVASPPGNSAMADIRHSDLIVSCLLHVHQQAGSYVDFDLVAGGGPVYDNDVTRIATTSNSGSGPFGPFGAEQSSSRTTFSGTVGIDVEVRLSRYLSVGPTLRTHFIRRGDLSSNLRGLGSVAVRIGAGARVTF